ALPFSLTPTRLADGLGRRSVLSVRALSLLKARSRYTPRDLHEQTGRVVPPRRTRPIVRGHVRLRQTNCQRRRILRLSNRQNNLPIAECELQETNVLVNPQSEIRVPKSYSAADVHDRPALRVFFGLAQDFARHGRGVAFTKDDVIEQILQRVAFAPTEIDVRHLAGRVAQVQQDGTDGVRHGRTFRAQDAKAIHVHAAHAEFARELRGVARLHFKE